MSVDDEVTRVDKLDNEPRSSSQRKVNYSHESQELSHQHDNRKGSLPCGDQRTKIPRVRAIGSIVGVGNLNDDDNNSHIDNTTSSDNRTRSTNNDNGITVSSSKFPSITRRAVPGPEYVRTFASIYVRQTSLTSYTETRSSTYIYISDPSFPRIHSPSPLSISPCCSSCQLRIHTNPLA